MNIQNPIEDADLKQLKTDQPRISFYQSLKSNWKTIVLWTLLAYLIPTWSKRIIWFFNEKEKMFDNLASPGGITFFVLAIIIYVKSKNKKLNKVIIADAILFILIEIDLLVFSQYSSVVSLISEILIASIIGIAIVEIINLVFKRIDKNRAETATPIADKIIPRLPWFKIPFYCALGLTIVTSIVPILSIELSKTWHLILINPCYLPLAVGNLKISIAAHFTIFIISLVYLLLLTSLVKLGIRGIKKSQSRLKKILYFILSLLPFALYVLTYLIIIAIAIAGSIG